MGDVIVGELALTLDDDVLDGDAEDFLDVVRNDLSLSKKDKRFPRKSTCMEIYSRRINGEEDLETVLRKYFPWCWMWQKELNDLFREYVERKQKQNVLDYDDLLLYLFHLLQDEAPRRSIGERFDHILVDEVQDFTADDHAFWSRLPGTKMAVGDDDQRI